MAGGPLSPRPMVAVVGSGEIGPEDARYRLARDLGEALVDAGYRVLSGGRGGVMRAVAEGGRASRRWVDGRLIGLLPGDDRAGAHPLLDIALPTGMGHGRNALVAHADALVAVGGGAGTLSELALGWVLGRLCIAIRCAGWSGELADRALDDRRPDRVWGAEDPAEVLAILSERLPVVYDGPPPSGSR